MPSVHLNPSTEAGGLLVSSRPAIARPRLEKEKWLERWFGGTECLALSLTTCVGSWGPIRKQTTTPPPLSLVCHVYVFSTHTHPYMMMVIKKNPCLRPLCEPSRISSELHHPSEAACTETGVWQVSAAHPVATGPSETAGVGYSIGFL